MSEKKKTLWPWAIVLVLVIFAGSMISVMTMFLRQDMHLVTDDYYAQEVRYQKRIDHQRNARESGRAPKINYHKDQQQLHFDFPDKSAKDRSGEIHLYRPSDADIDKRVAIKTGALGQQAVSMEGMKPGRWVIKVAWSEREVDYYMEQDLFIR